MGAWSVSLSLSLSVCVCVCLSPLMSLTCSLNRSLPSEPLPAHFTLIPPHQPPTTTQWTERKAPADQWTRTGLGCIGTPMLVFVK